MRKAHWIATSPTAPRNDAAIETSKRRVRIAHAATPKELSSLTADEVSVAQITIPQRARCAPYELSLRKQTRKQNIALVNWEPQEDGALLARRFEDAVF